MALGVNGEWNQAAMFRVSGDDWRRAYQQPRDERGCFITEKQRSLFAYDSIVSCHS
jgi:hypothetical protein